MSRKPEVLPNPRRQGLLSGPAFVAAMVAIAALLFFVAGSALPATFVLELGVLLVVLAAAMVGLSVGVLLMRWQQRRALDILRAGVLEAQEGNLHPVSVPAVADNYQRALFDEYNRMMSALGRMFTFVEECQNKYLHERNKMNVIVQGVPVALMTVDDNVVVTTANRQAEGLFEVPPQGLVGRDLFSLLPLNESDRDVLRDAFLYKQNVRNRVIRIPLGGM
ncbi:MAG: PAS domain-containing protein, partial [Chromatiales bacterium]|nr:PAS domain-containing protein [Chromatiales bacterium]